MFCSPMKSAPKFAQLFYRYRLWEIVSLLTRVRRNPLDKRFLCVRFLPSHSAFYSCPQWRPFGSHILYYRYRYGMLRNGLALTAPVARGFSPHSIYAAPGPSEKRQIPKKAVRQRRRSPSFVQTERQPALFANSIAQAFSKYKSQQHHFFDIPFLIRPLSPPFFTLLKIFLLFLNSQEIMRFFSVTKSLVRKSSVPFKKERQYPLTG